MINKIQIVNWLLTRSCNLKCDYCGIVRNNKKRISPSYPSIKHYLINEMPLNVVIDALKKFKKHNSDMFHIFYGGEPLLRPDLPDIINFCNENNIHYTIISNNTPTVQHLIKLLFRKTEYVSGFTSSVDPIFNEIGVSKDRVTKSIEGLKRLKEIQASGKVKDVVAEITAMNHNQHLLYDLVKELSEEEIYSDITFVDIAKNPYYDFSNVWNSNMLVKPTLSLAEMLIEMKKDDSLLIHMKDYLLPTMFNTLPANFDCELEKDVHNLTIDADGSIRLCLRIRGTTVPVHNIKDLKVENDLSIIPKHLHFAIKKDKYNYCQLCNHSCLMMSQYYSTTNEDVDELVHSDKREDT